MGRVVVLGSGRECFLYALACSHRSSPYPADRTALSVESFFKSFDLWVESFGNFFGPLCSHHINPFFCSRSRERPLYFNPFRSHHGSCFLCMDLEISSSSKQSRYSFFSPRDPSHEFLGLVYRTRNCLLRNILSSLE